MNKDMLMILLEPDTYVWLLALAMTLLTLLALFLWRSRRRWLRWTSLSVVVAGWFILFYGSFFGVSCLEVRHEVFVSEDLPKAFDGYRIVQFSDAHVGSFNGWRHDFLRQAVDSINALQADMIVFTGDLQNKQSGDIVPHQQLLSSLKARDGIFSILGNHDYPEYLDLDSRQKQLQLFKTCETEHRMGWNLLLNDHSVIRRGGDSLVIAGMENDGEGRFPQLGNINQTLFSINHDAFVVMLEHDPTSWRRKILPNSHCQLTLSGHTHGGQFSILGFTPAMFTYRDYQGMCYVGKRAMNVSTGLGGVVPIRFGVTPEIVVITLKSSK